MATRAPIPIVLLALMLGAIAVGGAASVLVRAPSAAPSGRSNQTVLASPEVLVILFVALVLVGFALLIYRRLTAPSVGLPNRIIVTALIALLIGVAFVAMSALLNENGSPGGSGNATGATNNSTGNTTGTTNGTQNLTGGSGTVSFLHFSVPPWLPLVLLFGVALVIAVIAAPALAVRLSDLRGDRERRRALAQQQDEALDALAAAARALEAGSDPRAVIQALYARLLARVGPLIGSVETETPEEIRTYHLLALGIGEAPANALTRLFEEARYSTHPLNADAADRAREAIRDAELDLDRRVVP